MSVLLQQLDDGGEHLLTRQAGRQVGGRADGEAGQRRGEGEQAAVLRLVADFAPARVIAILLAAAGVAAGGLDVAVADAGRSTRRVHAGGIASDVMRASTSRSLTARPFGST